MLKVMIVDDDDILVRALTKMIGVIGHEVVATATSGEDSIELARTCEPNLVLMDIMMPGGMDGLETALALKQAYDTPVIFITGYGNEEITERAYNVGHYGFLTKPVTIEKLKETIEKALSH